MCRLVPITGKKSFIFIVQRPIRLVFRKLYKATKVIGFLASLPLPFNHVVHEYSKTSDLLRKLSRQL